MKNTNDVTTMTGTKPAVTTCQLCGRPTKSTKGVIANHGYKRPGGGWQTASCNGARFLPYETSCDRIALEIERLEAFIAATTQQRADMFANPPAALYYFRKNFGGDAGRASGVPYGQPYGAPIELAKPAGWHPEFVEYSTHTTYTQQHANDVWIMGKNIDGAKEYVTFLRARLAAWVKVY